MVTVATLITELGIQDDLTPALERAAQQREAFRAGEAALNREILATEAALRKVHSEWTDSQIQGQARLFLARDQAEALRKQTEASEEATPFLARLEQVEQQRTRGMMKSADATMNLYRAEKELKAAQDDLMTGTGPLAEAYLRVSEATLRYNQAVAATVTARQADREARQSATAAMNAELGQVREAIAGQARMAEITRERVAGNEAMAAALERLHRAESTFGNFMATRGEATPQNELRRIELEEQVARAKQHVNEVSAQSVVQQQQEIAGLQRLNEVEAARVAGNTKLANALMGVYRAEQQLIAARATGNALKVKEAEDQLAAALQRVSDVSNSASNSASKLTGVFDNMGARILVAFRNTLLYGTMYQVLSQVQQVVGDLADDIFVLADQTGKLMQVTGQSAEEASSFIGAGKEWGLTNDQLAAAVGHLSVQQRMLTGAMEEGRKAGVEFDAAMRALGVTTTDANGNQKRSMDLFMDIADAIANTTDSEKAMTLAAKAFGETTARDMLPFLRQGRDGIRELMDVQQRYGNIITTKSLQELRQMNLALKDSEAAMTGLWLSIQQRGIPAMTEAADGLNLIAMTLNKELTPAADKANEAVKGSTYNFGLLEAQLYFTTINITLFIRAMKLLWDVGSLFKTGSGFQEEIDRVGKSAQSLIDTFADVHKLKQDEIDAAAKRRAAIEKSYGRGGDGDDQGLDSPAEAQRRLEERRKIQRDYQDLLTKDTRAVEDYRRNMAAENARWAAQEQGFARRRQDILTEIVRDQEDHNQKIKEALADYKQTIQDALLDIGRKMADSETERKKIAGDLARETLEVRTDLNNKIAEARRDLNRKMRDIGLEEVEAERKLTASIAEIRYDLFLKIQEQEYDSRLRNRELARSEANERADLNRRLAEIDYDWRAKETDAEIARVKARRDANKAIEDAEREHARRMDDIWRDIRELPTDFVTVDVLRARRELMGQLRDERRRGGRSIEDARRESGIKRDESITDIDRGLQQARQDMERQRAEAIRRTEEQIEEGRHRRDLADEEAKHVRDLATAEADHQIKELNRAFNADAIERKRKRDDLLDDFNHDTAIWKGEADARITELNRVAKEREADRALKISRDIEDFNTSVTRAYDETVAKIKEYDKDMKRKIEDADTATTRVTEDYKREALDHAVAQQNIRTELERTAQDNALALARMIEDNGDWVLSLNRVETAVRKIEVAYSDLIDLVSNPDNEAKLSRMTPEQLDELSRQVDEVTRQYSSGTRGRR